MGRSLGNGFEGGYCTLGLLASFAVSHAQPATFCEAGFDALAMFSLKKKPPGSSGTRLPELLAGRFDYYSGYI